MKKLLLSFTILSIIISLGTQSARANTPQNDPVKITQSLDIFNSLFKELSAFYVDTIDTQKCIETGIGAMLNTIDPYTEYIPAKSQDDYFTISTGEYGGVGSYITQRKGETYFSEPYEGSPAALAGVKAGDKIVMIDGDSVAGLASDKVSARLKGQQNTVVKLLLDRPNVGNISLDVTRKKIQVPTVPYYGVQRANLGYIALSTFNEKSAHDVKNALIELKKNPAVKRIVLDLRGNGGGLLESAVQIVGLFVPKGTEVVQTRGRVKQNNKIYKTTQEPIDTKPLL